MFLRLESCDNFESRVIPVIPFSVKVQRIGETAETVPEVPNEASWVQEEL